MQGFARRSGPWLLPNDPSAHCGSGPFPLRACRVLVGLGGHVREWERSVQVDVHVRERGRLVHVLGAAAHGGHVRARERFDHAGGARWQPPIGKLHLLWQLLQQFIEIAIECMLHWRCNFFNCSNIWRWRDPTPSYPPRRPRGQPRRRTMSRGASWIEPKWIRL